MQGKAFREAADHHQRGITPAYAGKSESRGAFAYNSGDHPRVCGEKRVATSATGTGTGSPPRMRGKGSIYEDGVAAGRITPAYAGKRTRWAKRKERMRDHPRVCGEKSDFLHAGERVAGSPPHMRGKERVDGLGVALGGITPAYAGKSTKRNNARNKGRDHPRVCGEKSLRTAAR